MKIILSNQVASSFYKHPVITVLLMGYLFVPLIFRYIARALETGDGFDLVDYSPSDFERFCHVIGEDGVMALKLTSSNSSEFVVCDVVCNMFNEWRGKVCTRTGNENVADVEKAERLYPEIKKAD